MRVFKDIFSERIAFVFGFWNKIELVTVGCCIGAIVMHFKRIQVLDDLSQRVDNKSPEVFINFQRAMKMDELFIFFLSTILFCAILKVIKLLRFNKRFTLMSETVRDSAKPLAMFGISFIVCFAGAVCISSLMFGQQLYNYRNVFVSISSCMRLVLGKFSFSNYVHADSIFGPVFFLYFNLVMNFLLLNMCVSIIDDSYHTVRERFEYATNQYEVLDYISTGVRGLLGLKIKQKEDEEDDDEGDDDADYELKCGTQEKIVLPKFIKIVRGHVRHHEKCSVIQRFNRLDDAVNRMLLFEK